MATILIVDDDPRIRGILDLHIEDAFGFSAEHAADGLEAVDKTLAHPPDLILMDLSMPNMNGIDAIRNIRALPGMERTPIIFLSAETDKSKWVEAFEAGANDFVPKPFQQNELLARISTHLSIANLTKELERKNRLLEKDRRLAENVQKQLLPLSLDFPGFEAAAVYEAQEQIGGDFFDAWEHEGRLHIALGDISGHGASAALLMAVCKGILSTYGKTGPDPALVVSKMNETLYAMLDAGELDMFVTLAYVVLDPEGETMRLVSCGHTPVHVASGGEIRKFEAGCPAVGLLPHFPWDPVVVPFHPGDMVFMHTDGLTELRNERGKLFGEDRLEALLAEDSPPRELVRKVLAAGLAFSEGKLDDDVAMMAVRMLPKN